MTFPNVILHSNGPPTLLVPKFKAFRGLMDAIFKLGFLRVSQSLDIVFTKAHFPLGLSSVSPCA